VQTGCASPAAAWACPVHVGRLVRGITGSRATKSTRHHPLSPRERELGTPWWTPIRWYRPRIGVVDRSSSRRRHDGTADRARLKLLAVAFALVVEEDAVNALRGDARGPADHAVDLVALRPQQLREERTVLASDAGDHVAAGIASRPRTSSVGNASRNLWYVERMSSSRPIVGDQPSGRNWRRRAACGACRRACSCQTPARPRIHDVVDDLCQRPDTAILASADVDVAFLFVVLHEKQARTGRNSRMVLPVPRSRTGSPRWPSCRGTCGCAGRTWLLLRSKLSFGR